jgi:hypothetical protein
MSIDKQKNFNCVAAAEHLHEYLDGELQPDLRAVMEQHLASCADCSATLAQLRQIETAHQQLDARLELPAEEYWQVLPQRVMEKVKASEKRRLLALPKLPRLKSSAKHAPVSGRAPKQDLLHLTPAVQKFLRGPAKYVLPLAAVAAFCFFMIREFWEKPETSITTVATSEQPAARLEPKETFEKAIPSSPQPAQEKLTEKPIAAAKKLLPAQRKTDLAPDSFLVAAAVQGAGGRQGADLSLYTKVDSPITFSERNLTPPAPSQAGESDIKTEAPLSIPEEKISLPVAQSFVKAKDQPAAPAEEAARQQEVKVLSAADLEKEAQSRDDQARLSRSRAAVSSAEGRVGVSVLGKGAAITQKSSEYDKTQQRAQQTSDLKKREKIWRDFLKSDPDSSYRALAISHLAQTLAAASDSTTKLDQLERNLAYFQDHAATLRPLMGAQQFERELARLQMLVNIRRNAPIKKP